MTEAEALKEEFQKLSKQHRLGLISEEYFLIQQNQLQDGGTAFLQKLVERAGTRKDTPWWGKIWPGR